MQDSRVSTGSVTKKKKKKKRTMRGNNTEFKVLRDAHPGIEFYNPDLLLCDSKIDHVVLERDDISYILPRRRTKSASVSPVCSELSPVAE
jgi:hypothetical protein